MAFESIGETLDATLRRGPTRAAFLALKVEEETKKVLPDWAKFLTFHEGRLVISTPSPTHSQELYLGSAVLRKAINDALGGKIVGELKLKIKT